MFQVSVIIPVYNASKFLEKAVNSAVVQPEVGEVILVEDGSIDNSYSICERLSQEFKNVKLLNHPDGRNMGVCHSRNLGIRNAQFDFIAFLDADDWYLPGRFKKDRKLFHNPEVMAVYSLSAIQYADGREVLFGSNEDLAEMFDTNDVKGIYCQIMKKDIILGHTNANTFRKDVFEIVGCFDPRLKLHEDTELWNRIARTFRFYAGELDRPVSIAKRHGHNTISQRSKKSQLYYLWVWLDNIGLDSLYPCEKKNFLYLFARAHTNSIRPHFLRKLVFHGIQILIKPFIDFYTKRFYEGNPHNS